MTSPDRFSEDELGPLNVKLLSKRETEVLALAASGFHDREIVERMGISLNTLRTYWQRIRGKVGLSSRSGLAVAYFKSTGQVESSSKSEHPDLEIDLAHGHLIRLKGLIESAYGEVDPVDLSKLERHISTTATKSIQALIRTVDLTRSPTFLVSSVALSADAAHKSLLVTVERDGHGLPIYLSGRFVTTVDLESSTDSNLRIGYWKLDRRSRRFETSGEFNEIYDSEKSTDGGASEFFSRVSVEEKPRLTRALDDLISGKKSRVRIQHAVLSPNEGAAQVAQDMRVEGDTVYGTVVRLI